jgi:osmotically-inducible protein OsmY
MSMSRHDFSPPTLWLLILTVSVAAILPCGCATTTAAAVDPAAVTAAVKDRLRAEDVSGLADLQVRTDADGTVWLSGRTYTQAAADRAMQIARTTPGATRVRSNILALPETPR